MVPLRILSKIQRVHDCLFAFLIPPVALLLLQCIVRALDDLQ